MLNKGVFALEIVRGDPKLTADCRVMLNRGDPIDSETYCGLAQEFYCHVFQANSEEEAKVILCTIAQGFERTHLMT